MANDYNSTINLPKTDFPMRANLAQREPAMLEKLYEDRVYEEMLKKNEGKPQFILHDGPPFSNGSIHIGTAMNKVLKDFVIRYKAMSGHYTPFTPGWDNHGMPIESAIIKQNKLNRKAMSIPEFRDACREFAMDFVSRQREQFKRLGVLGDWDHPYLTMDKEFEAEEVKIFGEMFRKGYIYRGMKPVYWCPNDETALAEAEIEYQDMHLHLRPLQGRGRPRKARRRLEHLVHHLDDYAVDAPRQRRDSPRAAGGLRHSRDRHGRALHPRRSPSREDDEAGRRLRL